MFQFKKVKIQNFMSIKNMELNLDNRGLVLIEGINHTNPTFRSNGTGKTISLSSITYALYGQTPTGLKADDVVNNKIGKDTAVKLYFDIDGQSYRIERYRKHSTNKNKVKLFQGNTELTGSSIRETDKKIQDLFGIDYGTYMNSIVQGQGDAEVFSQATDKGKKEILENITNISIYKKAQEIAKEKSKDKELELNEVRRNVEDNERELQNLHERDKQEKENYQYTLDSINESRENLKSYEEEHKEKKAKYPKDLKRRITKLKKSEAPTYPQIDWDNDDYVSKSKKEIEIVQQESSQEIDRLKQEKEQAVQSIESERKQVEEQLQPIMTNIEVMKTEVEKHKEDASQLDFTTTCPVCGNPLDATHAEKENIRLQELIKDKQSKIDETLTIYNEQLLPMLDAQDHRKQSIEKEYQDEIDKKERSANIEVKGIEQDISYYKSDKETEIRQKFEQAQVMYQNDINEREELVEKKNKLDNALSQLEQSIKSEKDTLKRLENLPKPKDFQQDIEAIQEALDKNREELLAVTDKINKYEDVVKLYSNTGIRSVVLDLVTPFLNEKANKYMATLSGSDIEILFSTQTENKDGSMSDKFEVEIKNASGGSTYKSNSEGEKRRIDMAISFAIQDLVLSKSDMETNIAIYDECFEGLDEVGTENVVKLLKERQDKVSSIFVITHNQHLKTLFEDVITVEKRDGLTQLVSE